jgi:hypothetical protein
MPKRRDILIVRSVAFGSAECVDRQGQVGLDAEAATKHRIMWRI